MNLLKLGVEIYSYNDHCSAPFSRACWLVSPPTLLGHRSRHCHGINIAVTESGVLFSGNLRNRLISSITFEARELSSSLAPLKVLLASGMLALGSILRRQLF